MGLLKRVTLRWKMNLIIISVTLISVTLGFVIVGYSTARIYKKNLERNGVLNARLIGEFALIPLTYSEKDRAKQTLNKLKSIPNIENCLIYDEYNNLFVSYSKSNINFSFENPGYSDTLFFTENYLHVFQPILFQTVRYGTAYLRISTMEIKKEIKQSYLKMFFLLLILVFVSLIISNYFQDIITKPIIELSKFTKILTENADYSIRLERITKDEIGGLYNSFNELLIKLDLRDKEKVEQNNLLKNKQLQLENIIDAIPHLIYLKSKNGIYVLVNQEFSMMYGLPKDDIIGKSAQKLFKREIIEDSKDDIVNVFDRGETIFSSKKKVDSFHGSELYLQVTKMPFNFNGEIVMLGIGIDITGLVNVESALRESKELFTVFMDRLPAATFMKNKASEYLYVNQYLVKNFNAQNWLNKYVVINANADKERVLKEDKKALEEAFSFEEKIVDKHGNIRYFESWKFPIVRDKKVTLIGGISIEITHRKRAEAKVNYYIDELKRNNVELSEFNYVASHDLREPLRTLTSYCDLLREDIGVDLSEDAQEDIDFITSAAKRMNILIQDLLELSRAGRVEIKNDILDVKNVIEGVLFDLKQFIDEKNAKILIDELPLIHGDEAQIRRVFQNLIHNAIKFNENEVPLVKIYFLDTGTDRVKFVVEDNGIGIGLEFLQQIFAPFKRLHSKSKYEGTGIGLAICKKIIERHGGNFEVKSKIGEGSQFIFSLKLNKALNL